MNTRTPIDPAATPPIFVRRKQEKPVFGISSSAIDRLIADGLFPKRRKIGPGCVGTLYEDGKAALEKLARAGGGE